MENKRKDSFLEGLFVRWAFEWRDNDVYTVEEICSMVSRYSRHKDLLEEGRDAIPYDVWRSIKSWWSDRLGEEIEDLTEEIARKKKREEDG